MRRSYSKLRDRFWLIVLRWEINEGRWLNEFMGFQGHKELLFHEF